MHALSRAPLSASRCMIGDNAVIMMGAINNIGAVIGAGTMIDMGAVLGGRPSLENVATSVPARCRPAW